MSKYRVLHPRVMICVRVGGALGMLCVRTGLKALGNNLCANRGISGNDLCANRGA